MSDRSNDLLIRRKPNLLTMDHLGRDLGRMSRRFKYAEGWRRHLHHGYCAPQADPLRRALGPNFMIHKPYERSLESGS